MEYPEHLGDCLECGKPVMYAPDMTLDDPLYPMYDFDQESREDHLYHWGCFDPALFADKKVGG